MPAINEYAEQLDLFPGIEQTQFHHTNTKGFVVLLQKFKNGKIKQTSLPAIQLPNRIYELCRKDGDCWMSQNGFYRYNTRKIHDIGQLVTLFVDLDCYKLNITPDEAIKKAYGFVDNKQIPRPSMVIRSGQGVQLIWRIEPETAYALPTWQGVEDWLIETLKPIGADPQVKDAARVLRVAGTFNKKNNALVEIQYDSEEIYSLTNICKQYILSPEPESPSKIIKTSYPKPYKKTTKSQEVNKIKRLFSTYTLYYARMIDVTKLIELRCGAQENRKRELLLFLYRYYSCMYTYNHEAALEEMLELNATFRNPLTTSEVEQATKSAQTAYENRNNEEYHEAARAKGYAKYGYNYKTATLIKLLEITESEQQHMTNLIGTAEKYRRKDLKRHESGRKDRRNGQAPSVDRQTYLLQCQSINVDKVAKTKALREEGLSLRKIAEEVGVSLNMVQRYLKK